MNCKITVEPVIFAFMLSSFMLLIGLHDLIYVKVCFTKYSLQVCNHLYDPSNKDALDEVQSSSSHWILAANLLLALPSILAAQFIGSWSDTYGTKIPMLIPAIGGVLSGFIYIGQSVYMREWPMSPLLLGCFIGGICGGYTSCILTCLNYISQITTCEKRTARVSILEGMVFIAGCSGPLLTGWIQSTIGRNFIFVAVMALQSFLTIYIIVNVENIKPRYPSQESWIKSAFHFKHMRESLSTIIRLRQENRRRYLTLLLIAFSVVKFCIASEIDVSYIYVRDKPIKWTLFLYTTYFSLKHGIGASSLMFVMPFLKKLSDASLLMIGLTSHIVGLVLLGLATDSTMMYTVAVFSIFSSWSLPVIRSALSKLVETDEKGKLFASLATIENVCIILASVVSNTLYPVTRHLHGFVFFLSALLLVVPFGIACSLYKKLKKLDVYSTLNEAKDPEGEEEREAEEPQLDETTLSSSSSASSIASQETVTEQSFGPKLVLQRSPPIDSFDREN